MVDCRLRQTDDLPGLHSVEVVLDGCFGCVGADVPLLRTNHVCEDDVVDDRLVEEHRDEGDCKSRWEELFANDSLLDEHFLRHRHDLGVARSVLLMVVVVEREEFQVIWLVAEVVGWNLLRFES